jgi:hypothetical protein
MKYRKLRIAWSVGWGVVAVLLCVLWVRSYSYLDTFRGRFVRNVTLQSAHGDLRLSIKQVATRLAPQDSVYWDSNRIEKDIIVSLMGFPLGGSEFRIPRVLVISTSTTASTIWMPHWLPAFSAIGIAIASFLWLRFRVSLRKLLIAMTLVALLLGLFVWLR